MPDILSPKGQWKWDPQSNDWVPNQVATQQPSTQQSPSSMGGGDNLKKAVLMDLMTTGGKNIEKIKTVNDLVNPKSSEPTMPAAKDVSLAKTGVQRILETAQLFKKDPSVLTKQLVPGKFFSRDFDKAMYDATDALLRLRTGAQANPAEIKGYMNRIAPSFGDSPEVVQNKLNNMLQDFANYSGETPKTINLQNNTQNSGKGSNLLNDLLIKPYKTTAGNVAAAGQVGLVKLLEKINPQAAAQLSTKDILGSQGAIKQTSEDPVQALVDQGLASADIYAQANLLQGLPKVLSGGKQAIKTIANPRAVWGEARTAAAKSSEATINTSKIVKAGEKYLESDPAAAKYFETAKTAIETADTPVKLLDRMKVWKSAFDSAGRFGKSSKAGLYGNLYEEALKELGSKAPDVMKYQKLLKLSYQIPKTAGKMTWQALKLSALGKLFGIGG